MKCDWTSAGWTSPACRDTATRVAVMGCHAEHVTERRTLCEGHYQSWRKQFHICTTCRGHISEILVTGETLRHTS